MEREGSQKHEPALGEWKGSWVEVRCTQNTEMRAWRLGSVLLGLTGQQQRQRKLGDHRKLRNAGSPWCRLRHKSSAKDSCTQHSTFLQIWNTIMLWVITQQFGEINTL